MSIHLLVTGGGDTRDLVTSMAWSCRGLDSAQVGLADTEAALQHIGKMPAFAEDDQVWVLSSECLVLQQGLGEWAAKQHKKGAGVLGVKTHPAQPWDFERAFPAFVQWQVPQESWECPPAVLDERMLCFSGRTLNALREAGFLAASLGTWGLPYGVFISWAVMTLGQHQLEWGTWTYALPPLYCTSPELGCVQVNPFYLQDMFWLFCSARDVLGFTDAELRDLGRVKRNERPCGPIKRISPHVTTWNTNR